MTAKKSTPEAEHGIAELVHEASDRAIEIKNESIATLGRGIDDLGKVMKQHPIIAIVFGMGAGYILSRLIHR